MKKNRIVSTAVIKRLPRYYRYLTELYRADIPKISSTALSEKMGLTASQIRQDLNCFGGFGQQGYGYNVEQLRASIGIILGLDENFTAILIGVGNLGQAIIRHVDFSKRGAKLLAAFDINPSIIGTTINNIPIYNSSQLEEFCLENKPDFAVLTLPKVEAVGCANALYNLGVKGFWNFSNMELQMKLPLDSCLENVHLSDSLMTLCYSLKEKHSNKSKI